MAGEKGFNLEDHRSCMTFDHLEGDFYQFMKTLIHLRHSEADFKSTHLEWLDIDKNLIAYKKNETTFIFNPSSKTVKIQLLKANDILMSEGVEDFEFQAYSYMIYK